MTEPTQWALDIAREFLAKREPKSNARVVTDEIALALDTARQQGYREGRDAAVAASDVGLWPPQIYREVAEEIQDAIRALTPEDKK